ncbi:OrNVorf73-like [Venturia canescens]|uniref:OrNVorf73-like n=1 Tax=Venturia canescens TaxID=32260 RepID=A0ACB9ZIH8_9HYME|nr:uncharacterized LOC122409817 [Venturia canescens]KAI5630608.1 OrNVorf73-like [Venturia canescens]
MRKVRRFTFQRTMTREIEIVFSTDDESESNDCADFSTIPSKTRKFSSDEDCEAEAGNEPRELPATGSAALSYDDASSMNVSSSTSPLNRMEKKTKRKPPRPRQKQFAIGKRTRVQKPCANAVTKDEEKIETSVRRYCTADEMVRAACLNIQNYQDLALCEWSELVLLHLAHSPSVDAPSELTWHQVQSICHNYEWSVRVSSAMKDHLPGVVTLLGLLSTNRREKQRCGALLPDDKRMFFTEPTIDKACLNKYLPAVRAITNAPSLLRLNQNKK